jgi:hypothetical protein
VPYYWKTYDIVVLPASFPYGGMENPNLTFLSSSLIAGDRSLTDVVAHVIKYEEDIPYESILYCNTIGNCSFMDRKFGYQCNLARFLVKRGIHHVYGEKYHRKNQEFR